MGCACIGHTINYSDLDVVWCVQSDDHILWTFSINDNIEIERSYQNLMQNMTLRNSESICNIDFIKLTFTNTKDNITHELFRKHLDDLGNIIRVDAFSNIPFLNTNIILSQSKRETNTNVQGIFRKLDELFLFGNLLKTETITFPLDSEAIKNITELKGLTIDRVKHRLMDEFKEDTQGDPLSEYYMAINQREVAKIDEENIFEIIIKIFCNSNYVFDKLNRELREDKMKWSKYTLYYLLLQYAIYKSSEIPRTGLINSMKALSDTISFYRGCILPIELISCLQKCVEKGENFVLLKEFISCTYDLNVATKYALKEDKRVYNQHPCIFEFILPIKFNCYSLVEQYSPFKAEREVLLASMNLFMIDGVQIERAKGGLIYKIILRYISDGTSNYDYLAYTTKKEIKLNDPTLDLTQVAIMLKYNKSIENLRITNLKFCQEEMPNLTKSLNYMNLKELYLNNNKLNDSSIDAISKFLKATKNLTKLDLSFNNITEEGALCIGEALRQNQSIDTLELCSNKIASGANYVIKSLIINKTLRVINLSNNELQDKDIECLNSLLNILRPLQVSLNVSLNNMSDTGAWFIASFLKKSNLLISLSLEGNQITHKGAIKLFESLKSNNSLEELYLKDNILDGESCLYNLVECLKSNFCLTVLEISNLIIDNEDLIAFSEFVKSNKILTSLIMTDMKYVGNLKLDVLANALGGNKYLETLLISFKNMKEVYKRNIK
jgi:hypothetical protein